MRIRRIALFSAGKMVGAVNALLALFSSLSWFSLTILFTGVSGKELLREQSGALSSALPFALGGFAIAISVPLVAGVVGFVFGLLGALFYNFLAGLIGGIVIEVD